MDFSFLKFLCNLIVLHSLQKFSSQTRWFSYFAPPPIVKQKSKLAYGSNSWFLLYSMLAKFRKSAYCLLASIFLWYLIKISKFQFTFPFLYWNNWDRTFWHCNYINLLFGFCYVVHFIFVWEYCIKDNSCNWCNCKSWKADYYSSDWEWNCSVNSA